MGAIATLHQTEHVFIDRDRLAILVRDHGDAAAERVIDHSLEEISRRLLMVETGWATGEFRRVGRAAQALIRIADRMGMHLLAHVACDVAALARTGEGPALAATVARLQRVGERSMLALWGAGDVRL